MNINPADLSDDQLARCSDEYVKRAIAQAYRDDDCASEYVSINIQTNVAARDASYKIEHVINFGWNNSTRIASNNVIRDARVAVNRHMEDKRRPVTEVVPLIAGPAEAVEYAEFEAIPSAPDAND